MRAILGRQQTSRIVALAGSLLIVAMIVSVVFTVLSMREREIENWRRQMDSMSLILAEQTSQTIFSAYMVLDAVTEQVREANVTDQASFRARMATPEMFAMLRDKIKGHPQVDVASIVAANGDNLNFSRSYPIPPINLAERDYFKAHLQNPDLGDFISQPVHNKGNGKWTFYISRRLSDAQGNFMGLVLVGMSVDAFTGFFDRIAQNIGEGTTISLFRNDLMLLARSPRKDDVVGTINRSGAAYEVIEVMKKKDDVLLRSTPRFSTGEPELRLTAVRTTERYPLVVVIVVTDKLILSGWRHGAEAIAFITLAGVFGLIFGLVALVRTLKQREANLVEMGRLMNEAQAANVAKSRFLATMSHELRTPMNGILGMSQLLLEPGLTERERTDYVRTILTSGKTLLNLLNDILDLSKVEAGKIEIESSVFNPDQLLAETQALFSGAAREKQLKIECQWYGSTTERFRSDSHRLRQMLFNLIGNAVKFTDQGGVRLEGRVIERQGDSVLLEYAVSDTGIGIPADKLDLLFRPFSQVDASATRKYGGTGLGLSIVEALARQMGGDVGVESEPGKGSRFWFRVRVESVPEDQDSRQSERAVIAGIQETTKAEGKANRVMVVEDDPINRKVIASYLAKLGLDVMLAANGRQAVEAIERGEQPDIVLMDVQMPVMDGCEATESIRRWEAREGKGHLPIVALTANVFEEDRKKCFNAGMDDFLTKPVAFDALKAMLNARWAMNVSLPTQRIEKTIDAARFVDLVGQITPMLSQNRFDAIPLFNAFKELAIGTKYAPDIDVIDRSLQQFRFDAVLEGLNRIVTTLNEENSNDAKQAAHPGD